MAHQQFLIEEREEIQRGLWKKESLRTIARRLGRAPSSISREIRKNNPPERVRYTPRLAEARAAAKRHEKQERLSSAAVRTEVIRCLKEGWSPEQAAGRVRALGIGTISHEAIYQFIYTQWRDGGEDLRSYLKRRHKARLQKGVRKWRRLPNPNKPSIEGRPKAIERRKRVGDWEGDLVVSRQSSAALVTLVDRKSGYTCIEKIATKTATETSDAMIKRLQRTPAHTLTLDNGSEHNHWDRIERETGVKVYFAHPYHSWERGTNENTNGLIRWYLPKGTNFAMVSRKRLREIERKLNERPRKRLGYRTPEEVFMNGVAFKG